MKREQRLQLGLFCAAAIALWFPLRAVVYHSRNRALLQLVELRLVENGGSYSPNDIYDDAKALLLKGADVNAKDEHGKSLISKAVSNTDTDMIELLEHFGAQKDAETEWFASALMGRTATIEKMLANGTKPNLANAEGNTALHFASLEGRVAIVKLLLKHGAKVNIRNTANGTPFDSAGAGSPTAAMLEAARILKKAGAKHSSQLHGGTNS